MAVGDFINVRPSDRDVSITRLSCTLPPETPASSFTSARLFNIATDAAPQRKGPTLAKVLLLAGLVGLIARALMGGASGDGASGLYAIFQWLAVLLIFGLLVDFGVFIMRNLAFRGRPKSLLAIMEQRHAIGRQPTANGFETIGIPFPHLLIVTGALEQQYRAEVEDQATAIFQKRWHNYVDPLLGPRARVLVSGDLDAAEIVAFFGVGVFAPAFGERPVGRVDVIVPGQAHALQPCLPDGTPAGLYKGQSALAFSASKNVTPASVEQLRDVSGWFCLRANADSPVYPYRLEWNRGENASIMPGCDPIPSPPGVDASFQVRFPASSFELHVVDDERPSRLLHRPPEHCGLAIVGVLEPVRAGQRPSRWWIDLDRHGRLVASAMREARYSLVCAGGTVTRWDWTLPGSGNRDDGAIEKIITPKGTRNVLFAPSNRPFGWLAAPEYSRLASFTPGRQDGFELDWLDFSGAVEDRTNHAERLGAAMDRANGNVLIPGLARGNGDDELLVKPASASEFLAAWRGDWQSGMQVVCEPFVLEMIEGTSR
jgi:hypothetical protein